MKHVFSSFLKSISIVTLLASSLAYANDSAKVAKADLVKGEALYTVGDAARGLVACVTCHGAAGNSTINANPKLAGQHDAYMVKQLQEFTTPDRKSAIMTTFAKSMTADDMKNVAAYLAKQTPKAGVAKNKDTILLGKKIYRGGIAEKNVPACAGCHSPNGAGLPAQFPRIAGQHQDYTVTQLTNFRTATRNNSAQMVTIAKRMSDDEMKAVADYIAGLK